METIALVIGFLGVLGFLGYYIYDTRKYINHMHSQLTNLPAELQKIQLDTLAAADKKNTDLVRESFKDFLKHIEKLERMTLPKPVSDKDVQSVLSRIGTMADESLEVANDIEQTTEKGVELPKDEWTGYINADTKVAFEEDDAPTVVENSKGVI